MTIGYKAVLFSVWIRQDGTAPSQDYVVCVNTMKFLILSWSPVLDVPVVDLETRLLGGNRAAVVWSLTDALD